MGYTHYWTIDRAANQAQYETALEDCRKIVRFCTLEYGLCNGMGEGGSEPDLEDGLCFNGCEEDGHEAFCLPPEAAISKWDFCKTARKPYDEVVVACLAVLADYGVASMSSDGEPSELTDGTYLAEEILGRKIANPLEESDE